MNKKWIMAMAASGVLFGACLFGVTGEAAEAEGGHHGAHPMGQHHMQREPWRMNDKDAAARAAEMFGVDEAEVAAYLAENPRAFRDIFPCSMLARTSGHSFAEVMAIYEEQGDWRAVGESLGVTREMIHETMGELMASRLADDKTNLTPEEARELLREGYHPRDVRAAGILGKAANKSAVDILAMKKINNGWDDVAKELGLDASVLREAFRPGWMMGGPGMGRPGMRGGEDPIPVPPPMPPQESE